VNSFYKLTLFYRACEGKNLTLEAEGEFVFNSIFESGNLDCVINIGEEEFGLFLRIDANTKGHVQWFYFSIRNGKRREKIKLNLCNLSKPKSLYENVLNSIQGVQPFIFSREAYRQSGKEWVQGGINLGLAKR
jgi:hypothetical protein